MKKRDLIKAARIGFPNVENMVNNMLRSINQAFVNGEKVTIYNFGEFYIHKCKIKELYDFKTGKRVPFDGTYTIKFRPAPAIKRLLNQKKKELKG